MSADDRADAHRAAAENALETFHLVPNGDLDVEMTFARATAEALLSIDDRLAQICQALMRPQAATPSDRRERGVSYDGDPGTYKECRHCSAITRLITGGKP